MKSLRTAVIQAGGRGTRMWELTQNKIPKPMLCLNGRPVIEWQILNLKKYGVTHIIVIVGHLKEIIKNYLRNGEEFGVYIEYIDEKIPLGSAGAFYYLKEKLTEDFLLVFGDIMFDVNLERMVDFHICKKSEATLLVHPNSHPYDSDIIQVDDNERVLAIISKNETRLWYKNFVNAGIYILSPKIFAVIEAEKRLDLERDILMQQISKGRVFAYITPEYVKDAGTPERFAEVESAFRKKIHAKKNLRNKQKCLFFDMDEIVVRQNEPIYLPESLQLENYVAEAIKIVNDSEYLAIIICNKSGIVHDEETLQRIEQKLSMLLGEKGAYADFIALCNRCATDGTAEEENMYQVSAMGCNPLTEMIDILAAKYNIERSCSYIIGDTICIKAGIDAGLKTMLVHKGVKKHVRADIDAVNIWEAVNLLLG